MQSLQFGFLRKNTSQVKYARIIDSADFPVKGGGAVYHYRHGLRLALTPRTGEYDHFPGRRRKRLT
jgi:hypothetical protein